MIFTYTPLLQVVALPSLFLYGSDFSCLLRIALYQSVCFKLVGYFAEGQNIPNVYYHHCLFCPAIQMERMDMEDQI